MFENIFRFKNFQYDQFYFSGYIYKKCKATGQGRGGVWSKVMTVEPLNLQPMCFEHCPALPLARPSQRIR